MRKKGIVIVAVLLAVMLSGCKKEADTKTEDTEKKESVESVEIIKEEAEETGSQMEETGPEKKGILIAIDPGHQDFSVDMSAKEQNGPGASIWKAKASTGTVGVYSNIPEFQLNLDISLMLREELVKNGYDVIMTREDNMTAISNSERAMLANNAGADVSIRIHANGSEDGSVSGALALIPSSSNPYVSYLYEPSNRLADCVLTSYCESTGFRNLGITQNDTMTGINWSQVPVMILEMGFMTNQQDDLAMADPEFRKQMVSGIVAGIDLYFSSEIKGSAEGVE